MRKLDARLSGGELPVNRSPSSIAGGFDRCEFVDARRFRSHAALSTLASKDPQFDCGHVPPTSVLRRIMKFHLLPQPLGFSGGKGVVERAWFVSIEIGQDHPNPVRVGIALIDEPLHLMGKVSPRPLRRHNYMPPSSVRLTAEKEGAGPITLVLIIVAGGASWLRGQRLARLADQLFTRLIKGDRRALGVIRLGI